MVERRAHVHLKHGLDAAQYRAQYLRGEVPDETPYGFHHAERLGWRLTYSADTPESAPVRFLRRVLMRVLGFDLVHAYRNRKLIAAADIIWTMEEIQFLAVCALPSVVPRMRRVPLIAQTVWLFNKWSGYSAMRRALLRHLLRRADALTFHSERYLPVVAKLVPGTAPRLLPFGISTDSFPWIEAKAHAAKLAVADGEGQAAEGGRPMRLLSMGSDPTRDWTTLLAAFGSDARFALVVICPWLEDATAVQHSNLQVPRNPSMTEFRAWYAWADLVVVPMVPNLYSGITVALEATSLGVPVVSSDTGGIATYFSKDEVLYVPPSDAEALRAAVLAMDAAKWLRLAERAQKRFRAEDYSTGGMAARYAALSEELLDAGLVRV